MPNPNRKPPLALVGSGFCRFEIQKVLKKYHAIGASAWLCINMYRTVIFLRDPKYRPLAEKPTPHEKTVSQFLTNNIVRHRDMFASLLVAVVASDKRLLRLPKSSPERVVEENFSSLSDVHKNKKLAEALPGYFRGSESAVRYRLSRANRIQAYWENAAESEAEIEAVEDVATGNFLLYQKRPKK